MSWRFKNIALVALCCALTTGLSAWADTAKPNPVTGETETYENVFTGGTEWNDAANWDTSTTPFISGNYDPALVDGNTVSTTTAIDGWTLRVGAYNNASVTWSGGISKIQAGTTGCWLTADETSSITIASFGGAQLEGSDSAPFKLTSANAGGITWSSGLTSASNTSLPFWYYLKGDGTVIYGGDITVANAQVIKQADITLSGTSQVASKTLVTFGSGTTKTFAADAVIKRLNSSGTDLGKDAYVGAVNTTGSSTLTTSDDVGKCELVQTSIGIVLYWVDGDPAAVVTSSYKPSININFTNGAANGLTTSDDVGLAGYEVPGTSWNNFVVANNATFSTVKSTDSIGASSVLSGVSVTISGTRGSYNCSGLTAASNPLHGYIDESAAFMTPTVTVTGIPYYKYRVIVYHSTDSANVPFGYDTVNGTNYTYDNGVLAEGTAAWGASGAADSANAISEGGNTLVTGELSGTTLTVVGHRAGGASNARGCIAAIQIIEVKPYITENDLIIEVSGDTAHTVTAAEAAKTGKVYLTGSGTLTLSGDSKISATTIEVTPLVTLNVNTARLDATTYIGGGTVVYANAEPPTGKGWTDSAWTGMVWINGKSGVTNFNVNQYGNGGSSVKISGVDGWVSAPGNYTYTNAVPIILENGSFDYALKLTNGNSPNADNPVRCTAFVKVSGSGTILDGNTANPMVKIFDGSDFTGTITLTRARIVFCQADSTTLPAAYNTGIATASIYVDAGMSVTVPSDKVWSATNGIKVCGELSASGLARFGDSTTITTTDNGVFTLIDSNNTSDHGVDYARITGTGTLRYADATGWRSLSTVNFPTNMVCENNLSQGLILTLAGGTNTIGSLAGSGVMRSDWGSGNRNLRILQARDTTYSGLFHTTDRIGTVTVAPGVFSAGTLTLAGTQTVSNELTVESGAAVNLTGTWIGNTTVSGAFGGTGTLTGDLTFNAGSTLRKLSHNKDGVVVTGTLTYPSGDSKIKVDVSALDLTDEYGVTLLSGLSSVDVTRFELIDTSIPFHLVADGGKLVLVRESDYPSLYNDSVTFTLNNVGSTPVANYTLLVRISKDSLPGFSYERAGKDGSEIAFTDGYGEPLSHDIDTWNIHGESLVWVKVPYAQNGTKVTFYWSLKDGKSAPSNDPTAVWSDYAGVWHMSDATDASGNSADGTLHAKAKQRSDGKFGGAYGRIETGVKGPIATMPKSDAMNALTDGSFTVSAWVRLNSSSALNWPYFFSRKDENATAGWGVQLDGNNPSSPTMVWADGTSGNSISFSPTYKVNDWVYMSVVLANGSATMFVDGVQYGPTAKASFVPATDTDLDFYIGGARADDTGSEGGRTSTLNGDMDEVRLYKGTVSAVRVQAEYANVQQTDFVNAFEGDGTSFLVPGAVVIDGIIRDYWRVKPSLSPASWDIGTSPSLTYTPGALRSGAPVTVTIETSAGTYRDDFDGNPASLLSISETGSYRLHVSRTDKTGAEVNDEYVYFTVTTPSGVDTVGDTAVGRILLMNNDFSQGGTAAEPSIGSQGYSDTNETKAVYWEFADREPSGIPAMNVLDGTNSMLLAVNGSVTNKLWHLVSSRHGNTYPSDGSALDDSQNYLPWSSQSCSITNGAVQATTPADAGQILMLNTKNAVVYSPCYTNGIGTIYFDAVNGWNNDIDTYDDEADGSDTKAYQFVVEVSNADPDVASTNLTAETDWTAVECHVVRVSATAPVLSEIETTTRVKLAIDDGAKTTEFYRIYVPIEERGTIRFRIRRTGINSVNKSDLDSSYLVLDNIIVSYPRMTAELRPAGVYFAKERRDVLGVEGAFADAEGKSILPVVGDAVYGKAMAEYYVNASTNLTETNFIASARMHYRWRYLNQLVGSWNTVSLKPSDNFKSENPLTIPDMAGDVEFWFDATLEAPYYKYVDYSGSGLADAFVSEIYSEKVSAIESRASGLESYDLPSAGTNWFVRLRDCTSAYEGIYLHTQPSGGSVCETNSMMLVANGQWRGFVKTMSEIEAGLNFRFEGVKLSEDEKGSVTFTTNVWKAATDATDSLPASRGVDYSEGWSTAKCDAKTGYLVFTFDEERETITVCRGDWQDFNLWSSAVTNLFVGSSIDTNSTTSTARDVPIDMSKWTASEASNANLKEDFDVPSTLKCAEVYPRDTPITYTNTLNDGWVVENASWTDQKWAYSGADSDGFGGRSAAQLQGRGYGRLSYVSTNNVDGLEAITFSARLAQFNEFNNFAYYSEGTNTSTGAVYFPRNLSNYTFITYGALTLDKVEQNYDGDGSLSLVAYYDQQKGAYEARVSRGGSDGNTLRIALFKWYAKAGGMVCDSIGYKEFPNAPIDGLLRSNGNVGSLCRFYISVQERTIGTATGTMLHAGVSNSEKDSSGTMTPAGFGDGSFENIVYFDTSDTRLTKGTFGTLTRNCAGVFIRPSWLDSGITGIAGKAIDTFTKQNTLDRYQTCAVEFAGSSLGNHPIYETADTVADREAKRDALYERWVLPPGRTEAYKKDTSPDYWGFVAVTNVSQTIAVQTAPHGASSWTTVTNITVNSFKNTVFTNYVYSHTPCDIRLQVGGNPSDPRLDVTVDDIVLSNWNGVWTDNYQDNNGFPSNFVYTSAWIVQDDDEVAQKAVRLQPARAKTDSTPVSLRSAVINGAGLFHFNWRNADAGNVKLLLQKYEYNTASMSGRLRYATEASADSTGAYQWTTIGDPILITEASGGKTIFLNERYDGSKSTVLRLIVDPGVVATARAGTEPYYGSIEITDSYVWDLPPYDKRSWTGWNFRADGWRDSKDTIWANLTDYRSGLSGLLNNTLDTDTLAEPSRVDAYKGHMPYIQSPTFETNCIGSVEFRARLYDPEIDAVAGYPALVSVYGAKKEKIDAATGEPSEWTKLADVEVSGTVYEHKSVKFKSGDQYCVLRFSVRGVPGAETPTTDGDTTVDADHNPPLRVAIDDICILERPIPSIRFKKGYARPFRNSDLIKTTDPVLDIDTYAEQPILGETFGFQAEIELNDLEGEIVVGDPTKPIRVYVAYYPYTDTWGWKNWISTTNESGKAVAAELVKADGTDLVFRSSLDTSDSFCPAQMAGGDVKLKYKNYRLVQYHFFATYYDSSGELHAFDEAHNLESDEWSMPDWNWGFTDPNTQNSYFSAFTLLESLAPKQAWINEVNLTDGTTSTASRTNQWIEIAVPTAVDMKGWSVRYYNNYKPSDPEESYPLVGDLFYFGGGNASSANNATEDSKDYSFYVARSPQTTTISKEDAHATWDAISYHGVSSGFLPFARPAGFELVRPSGVVEHSVVIQGYNEWENSGNESAARGASGTNFVDNVLKPLVGGDWVWGEEDKYKFYGYTAGVTNNMGGAHEDWSSPLEPTPFKINTNQVIGDGWYKLPNGGYYRIYANLTSGHLSQLFGEETGSSVVMTVTEGTSTNIVYTVDKWYQLKHETDHPAGYTVLDPPVTLTDGTGRRVYTLHLNNISNTVNVAASADPAKEVADLIPEGKEGDAYKSAIMNWLENEITGDLDSLTNAVYRGHDGSLNDKIDLVGMYWLDLDPTKAGWELWGGMGPYGGGTATNRVEAAGTTNRWHSTWKLTHTNTLVSAWLMITNTVSGGPAFPPCRLQGLANEKSDTYTGDNNWTSVTFKISMQLSAEGKWRDISYFTFDANSFAPANSTTLPPFTTIIEIKDPHSKQSPAVDWGWDMYPTITPWAKWKIDMDSVPVEPAVLKKEHYLDGEYP